VTESEVQAVVAAVRQDMGLSKASEVQAVRSAENSPVVGGRPLAGRIDHTLLTADADLDAIHRLCDQALQWSTASVCVNPMWVETAAEHLQGSVVQVCSVVGFPLGACQSEVKAHEARLAIEQGAQEVDMVMALGWFRAKDWGRVLDDIVLVRRAVGGCTLKVILETGLWTAEEVIAAATIAVAGGADYVKTSTGFLAGGGATVGGGGTSAASGWPEPRRQGIRRH